MSKFAKEMSDQEKQLQEEMIQAICSQATDPNKLFTRVEVKAMLQGSKNPLSNLYKIKSKMKIFTENEKDEFIDQANYQIILRKIADTAKKDGNDDMSEVVAKFIADNMNQGSEIPGDSNDTDAENS